MRVDRDYALLFRKLCKMHDPLRPYVTELVPPLSTVVPPPQEIYSVGVKTPSSTYSVRSVVERRIAHTNVQLANPIDTQMASSVFAQVLGGDESSAPTADAYVSAYFRTDELGRWLDVMLDLERIASLHVNFTPEVSHYLTKVFSFAHDAALE
ncbi:hypothetical protein IscW_ISCW002605 [Ixodes scapularis]|uniref:Uncharacterized protein n=1 Tax=Ixodes scapularis TaxID=6945 RepID=B7PCJ4_IXOSC|nr:hypothetical protein IscW_ISCW002605 [Ixodes scapularis]|eukprot:XP_002409922.1 hypothetical protein IscW_ISCW002605 [Ixodes scapularis]